MPTALIVEDEPEANQLLAMLVQLRGYETESAFTGGEALRKIDAARPDIVFLDLMLPDINGYDVCKTVKSRRETSGVPIVMVTARLASENRVLGFRAGAEDYIPKPYTPDQIFQAMTDARDWNRRLRDRPGVHCDIVVDTRADFAHLKALSHLRGLILERTPLHQDAVRALGQCLVELSQRAIEFGRKCGGGEVAAIRVQDRDDRLEVVVDDRAEWLSQDPPGRAEGLGQILAKGPFAEIAFAPESGRLTLICPFREVAA